MLRLTGPTRQSGPVRARLEKRRLCGGLLAAAPGALGKAVRDGQLPRLRDLAAALGATPLDPRIVSRLDPLGAALADIDSPEDLETPSPR